VDRPERGAELRVLAPGDDCCPRCTLRARYARIVADRVGLRDWVIEVDHDPADGALARVRLHGERRALRLSFADGFELEPEDEQRHAVVHELVHPHLRDLFETVRSGAEEEFTGVAYRLYIGAVRRDVERTVDAVAEALAPAVPFPSEIAE
jgi:hypothetical protein